MKNLLTAVVIFLITWYPAKAQWSALGTGTDNQVVAMTIYNGQIMVGGGFQMAGGKAVNKLARWTGSAWDTVAGVPGPNASGFDDVASLEMFNGQLFMSKNLPPSYISSWNGFTWTTPGLGLNNVATDMVVFNSALYVAGGFTGAGTVQANRVAKWDGTNWSAVGAGFDSAVFALAVYKNELYAAGMFSSSGGNPVKKVAKWNGTDWVQLGSGITGKQVVSMTVWNDKLVTAGWFTNAGGVAATNIAAWNDTSWSSVGSGIAAPIGLQSVNVLNSELYAAGKDNGSGGMVLSKYNGSGWTDVGAANGPIYTTLVNGPAIYVGGLFSTIGGVAASNIAKYIPVNDVDATAPAQDIAVYPNPFTDHISIQLSAGEEGQAEIYSCYGAAALWHQQLKAGANRIETGSLAAGIYFLKLSIGSRVVSRAVVRQ